MNLENISQQELIQLLKESMDTKELQAKNLATFLHGEMASKAIVLKLHTELHCMDIEKRKLTPADFKEDIDMLIQLISDFRKLIVDLHPSFLSSHGLLKAIQAESRSLAQNHSAAVIVQDGTSKDKFLFDGQNEVHIFKLYVSILDFLLIQNQHNLKIGIYNAESTLHIDFENVNPYSKIKEDHLKNDFLASKLRTIQTLLLVLEARISKATDWLNLVEIEIPLSKETQ